MLSHYRLISVGCLLLLYLISLLTSLSAPLGPGLVILRFCFSLAHASNSGIRAKKLTGCSHSSKVKNIAELDSHIAFWENINNENPVGVPCQALGLLVQLSSQALLTPPLSEKSPAFLLEFKFRSQIAEFVSEIVLEGNI